MKAKAGQMANTIRHLTDCRPKPNFTADPKTSHDTKFDNHGTITKIGKAQEIHGRFGSHIPDNNTGGDNPPCSRIHNLLGFREIELHISGDLL
jgi:hypothetical protein